ncbi:hypothetical protein SipoB123_05545 [Streptomyces ipomoeae]|nr:hypothetical protein SipoB123_05545 [Streptomyces ipomoeae]
MPGAGCRVPGAGCRVPGAGCRVPGAGGRGRAGWKSGPSRPDRTGGSTAPHAGRSPVRPTGRMLARRTPTRGPTWLDMACVRGSVVGRSGEASPVGGGPSVE